MSLQTPIQSAAPTEPNSTRWAEGRFVRNYSHRQLRPVEVLVMLRHQDSLRGRVLELGCGAGRVTGYLIESAEEVHAIDLAPAMIAEARTRYPEGHFIEGDIRDLAPFADGSFDAVIGSCAILDIFGDAERHAMLEEIHRVLGSGGLLFFSSHNRAHVPQLDGPTHLARSRNPLTQINDARRIPARILNHRRLAPLERDEPRYALVNNAAHDFSLLHYFIERDAQFEQLGEAGFEPLQCLDLDGREVGPGQTAAYALELHYTARRP